MPVDEEKNNRTLTNEKHTVVQSVKPEPIRVLFEWEAPARLFKRRDREYFTTIGSIVLLLVIILFFLKEWLLIMVIIAMMFTAYVYATVQPEPVKHKITNKGVFTAGRNYPWHELGNFWFTAKYGQEIVHIDTNLRFPPRLMLLVNSTEKTKIEKVLAEYLLLEKPPATWMDNASDWLSQHVPLEKTS